MYRHVSSVDESVIKDLLIVLEDAEWKEVKGPGSDFKTWHGVEDKIEHIEEIKDLWPIDSWSQAFFLSIPPNGKVHKHVDTERPEETYHMPIQTNDKAMNCMYNPDKKEFHLEVGQVYHVDRQVWHDSVNNGTTDRIHLLLEIK